jgi:hypothetical protein
MIEGRSADTVILTEQEKHRQRVRSTAIAWGLTLLAVLFFVVTIVRLGVNVGSRVL